MNHNDYADSLRQLAELMEENSFLPLPSVDNEAITFHYWGDDPQELIDWARAIPGSFAKNDPSESYYDSEYYILTGSVPLGMLTVRILSMRSTVCERVQTGTMAVHHEAVQWKEAYTEERAVFSYECKPLHPSARELVGAGVSV